MSGLQNFLAPFSHLLFWNRNLDIVVLCFALFFVTITALLNRWRADRLERDLTTARSNLSVSPAGRRYAASPMVADAPPAETGGPLPPVKGGRTYARNLGSALQKAGMSQPIYSPPTPAGWTPQANPGQPGGPQPGMTPPYATPSAPWATPPAPPTAPWAFPAGPGRNLPGPSPSSAPFYQPQPVPMPQSPAMPGPNVYSPSSPGPGAFPPPAPLTGPFAPPPFPTPATSGPAAPSFTPPTGPNPMATPLPAPSGQEAPVPDSARRGKPKRRRFNFNVLENLEKMVQSRPSEPAPPTTWTPPAAPPPAPTPAQATFSAIPQPPAPPAAQPSAAPVEPKAPAKLEGVQIGPFQFGPRAESAAASKAAEPAVTEPGVSEPAVTEPSVTEPVLDFSAPAVEEKAAPVEETTAEPPAPSADMEPQTAQEPAPPAEPEPKPEPRRSMRSMMFGEEPTSPASTSSEPDESAPAEPTPAESPTAESTSTDSETAWPSYPWNRRDEASSSVESEPKPSETPAADEGPAEPAREAEAEANVTAEPFDPWQPSVVAEPEPWTSTPTTESEAEPAATHDAEPVETHASDAPEAPVAADGEQPSAGTVVIIEDDKTAASYYETLFKGNGYRVEVANDGVSGVDLCARVQPQVILLDVMMPRQNGILVLQTLRASDETKNTPVVVMSNFSEPTLIKRALQLGALEYVIKTQVEGPALLNALPRWMNREKAFAAA